MLSSYSSVAKVSTAPSTLKAGRMPFDHRRMKARREELGLTQQQLADKVGVPYRRIQDHEYGTSEPKAGRLGLIADALDTTADWLLDRLDDPEPLSAQELAWLRDVRSKRATDFDRAAKDLRKDMLKRNAKERRVTRKKPGPAK